MPIFQDFIDTRDGNIYKMVLMPDGNWWSSEDLRYESGSCIPTRQDSYTDSDIAKVRLYTYNDANISLPNGVHIPTLIEWNNLIQLTNTSTNHNGIKSSNSGWLGPYRGTNTYGLKLLGSNSKSAGGGWSSTGYFGVWWSSTPRGPSQYFSSMLGDENIITNWGDPLSFNAVRFIVDIVDPPTTSLSSGKYYTKQKVSLSHPTLPIYYDTI